MAAPVFDRDRAARILVDAELFGIETTCDKWQISRRTLERYREKLRDDPGLSQVVAQKKRLVDEGWQRDACSLVKKTLAKLEALVGAATVENIRDVAGVLKIAGDLLITQTAIDPTNDEPEDEFKPGDYQQSQATEETPGADPLEEEDEEDSVEDA